MVVHLKMSCPPGYRHLLFLGGTMHKSFKILLVTIVFGVPITVIVFLHLFGNNRFDVPVYFENGNFERDTVCDISPTQHVIPIFSKKIEYQGHLTVVVFPGNTTNMSGEMITAYFRLCERNDNIVQSVIVTPEELAEKICDENILIKYKEAENLRKCSFMASKDEFVLLDGKGRIRGYYYAIDTEETDRLLTEIEILIQNGEYE